MLVSVLVLAVVAFFFWRRKLNRKGSPRTGNPTAYLDGKQELPLNEKKRYEMPGTHLAHELPVKNAQ